MAKAKVTTKGNIKLTLTREEAILVNTLTGGVCTEGHPRSVSDSVYYALEAVGIESFDERGDYVFPLKQNPHFEEEN